MVPQHLRDGEARYRAALRAGFVTQADRDDHARYTRFVNPGAHGKHRPSGRRPLLPRGADLVLESTEDTLDPDMTLCRSDIRAARTGATPIFVRPGWAS